MDGISAWGKWMCRFACGGNVAVYCVKMFRRLFRVSDIRICKCFGGVLNNKVKYSRIKQVKVS